MRIGQIVFIDVKFTGPVQTGIITKKEQDADSLELWYEVLCNDGQNHVFPGWLLSPVIDGSFGHKKKYKYIMKKYATLYKNNPHLITLYT